MKNVNVLVQVDKTVIKVTGLSVRGLNTSELESILQERLKSMVRIIGVSGSHIEMDVYGISEEDILRDQDGFIQTLALADGITVNDVTAMERVKKIYEVPFDKIPEYDPNGCKAERWIGFDK